MSLRLQLLGGVRAYDGGRELSWVATQPVRSALLLYLAVEQEATRDHLAHIFWPDDEIEQARHSLSQTLYLLRRALGEGIIQQQGDVVRLAAPLPTDVREFEAAVAAAELDRAASLYRGAFLKDVRLLGTRPFEEWVDGQRARLERLHRRLRRSQIDERVTAGDVAAAIEAARAWVEVEPFEDEAQHRLIELLALAGRRQEALAQFDSYERILRAEELEPLDETKALVAELRAGRAAAGDRPALEALVLPAPAAPPATQSPLESGSSGVPAPASAAAAARTEPALSAAPAPRRRMLTAALVLGAVVLLTGAGTTWLVFRHGRSATPPPAPRRDSLAVLACTNLTGDPAQEYFSDGVAQELLQGLSGVENLQVRSSQSSFAFKGRKEGVQAIAARLRVGHVVECNLRRSGSRVRIDVRLVNARDSVELARRYERHESDVLAMEEEIASSIVSALKLRLLPGSERPLIRGGTRDARAREAYYRGLASMASYDSAGISAARRYFELATTIDPEFAQAWARLALTMAMPPQERARLERQIRAAVRRALELDSTLAEPHIALARLEKDQTRRTAEYEEALRLDPAAEEALYLGGMDLVRAGDRPRARAWAERLLLVNLTSPSNHYKAATILNWVGEYARADSAAAAGARLDSLGFGGPARKWPPFWNCGYASLLLRKFDRAARLLPRAYDSESDEPNIPWANGTREVLSTLADLARDGSLSPADRARALAVLRRNDRRMQPHIAAVVYLMLGDTSGMYEYMTAVRNPRSGYFWPAAVFDPVRNEPRFRRLMAAALKP